MVSAARSFCEQGFGYTPSKFSRLYGILETPSVPKDLKKKRGRVFKEEEAHSVARHYWHRSTKISKSGIKVLFLTLFKFLQQSYFGLNAEGLNSTSHSNAGGDVAAQGLLALHSADCNSIPDLSSYKDLRQLSWQRLATACQNSQKEDWIDQLIH